MRIKLLHVIALVSFFTVSAVDAEEPTVTRGYVDARYGQIHYRMSTPVGDSGKPALICFHHTPGSSRHFDSFMGFIGRDRVVIAFDTPGYGQSDGPPSPVTMEEYAAALVEAMSELGYGNEADGSADLMGYLTGSYIATEIAVAYPRQVRRLVLVSSPVWTEEERPGRVERWDSFETWSEDGSYVLNSLKQSLSQLDDEPPAFLAYRLEGFIDGLLPGERWDWAERAAIQYRAIEKQPLVSQPTLALILHDFDNKAAHRAQDLIANVKMVEQRQVDRYAFKQIPQEIADTVSRFLDDPS